jgi:hypothetical protein
VSTISNKVAKPVFSAMKMCPDGCIPERFVL